MDYPDNHPFLDYPETPKSINLMFIVFLKLILFDEQKIIVDLLEKCKAVEKGKFSNIRFMEGIDEVLVLYYVLIDNLDKFRTVLYEPSGIFDNNKKLEYSLVNEKEHYMVNFEVKTMLCDPFIKENGLPLQDGTVLFKRLVNTDENIEEKFPDAIELKNSVYYSGFKRNIRKIIEKFNGEKMISCKMINIGFVCVHFSTSMEEFYTYLFHREKGFFMDIDWGNLDALVLFVCDAKNDLRLDNIYNMGYINTILINDDEIVQKHLHEMRLDNYVSIGKKVQMDIYNNAQKSYVLFKILKRDGFVNIIPYESTEEEIQGYVEYLKGNEIRR